MSIHKSVYVTSFNDVLTEARGNINADRTLISYVIWSPIKCFMPSYIRLYILFFGGGVFLKKFFKSHNWLFPKL